MIIEKSTACEMKLGTILEVNKGEEFKDSSAWEQMFCV
jgi:hypothetical protein